jgi:acid phosphatase
MATERSYAVTMSFAEARRVVVMALVSLAAGCGARTSGPPASAPHLQAARHTHENLNAVLWMQTAAEYKASAVQAYRLARLQLDAALADPSWTAATEQTNAAGLPPAVILDLDETVLDNSAFEARLAQDASAYSEDAWNQWVEERKAGAVPGALEFVQYAAGRGVTLFYVTNRDHRVEDATRDVMARLGVPLAPDRDVVLARHENGWDASDKSSRRLAVARTHRILLLVGDNFEDFVGGTRGSVAERDALMRKYAAFWGRQWIVLPNPTYGSWESALTVGAPQPSDAQTLAAKYRALRTDR